MRIALALVLVGLSIWMFSPYLAYRVATSAFVNADVMRVKAPIRGQLTDELPHKGEFIKQASKLNLIKSFASDRRRLLDLERQQTAASEQARFDNKQIAEIEIVDDELGKRIDAYKQGMVKRTGYEIEEAEAEKVGCLAEVRERQDISSRMQGLANSGKISLIRSAESQLLRESAETKCAMTAARVERLKSELHAQQSGVFLRDSSSDVPYSQQQRERLFLRRQELETDANQQSSRASRLAANIAEERRQMEHLDDFALTLPPDHVVWSVPATPGSAVTEGQTVLDLADCDHRFVAVQLPEREFEQIKMGDSASVRLIGSDEWRTGEIRQVRGSAALDDGRLLAARVPVPTQNSITVEVSLPPNIFRAGEGSYCDIGRLAEVRFSRTQPGIVASMNHLLQSFVSVLTPSAQVARQ